MLSNLRMCCVNEAGNENKTFLWQKYVRSLNKKTMFALCCHIIRQSAALGISIWRPTASQSLRLPQDISYISLLDISW